MTEKCKKYETPMASLLEFEVANAISLSLNPDGLDPDADIAQEEWDGEW